MATLVDTGVLLRAFDVNFARCRANRQALRTALEDNEPLFVTVQNIAEFWNVATRPIAYNGQGLAPERVKGRLRIIERLCRVIAEDLCSYDEWKRLVGELGVSGVKVHDARLVAVMRTNNINAILTLNEGDFRRYVSQEVAVFTPEQYRQVDEPDSPASL